jgi:hypothetical protein
MISSFEVQVRHGHMHFILVEYRILYTPVYFKLVLGKGGTSVREDKDGTKRTHDTMEQVEKLRS